MVRCCVPRCSAAAHCKCGGYKTKAGAKRAKFYCPSCRAKKLMTGSSKSEPHSPSPIATVSTQENMQRNDTCLCDRDNFCTSCVSLKAVAERLSTALSDSKRENQTLQLQILGLEDRVRALEEAVKSLGRLEAVEKEIESLKAAKVPAQQGQSHRSHHPQTGPRPRGYGRPRQRDAPGRKSEASEGASLRPSNSGRQAINDHTGRTLLDAKRRRSTNPFCDSYRIVWGTRFTTSAPTVRSTIAGLLKQGCIQDFVPGGSKQPLSNFRGGEVC